MELLFVSHKYPPDIGGMEKQSFELINGMRQYATVHSIVYDGKGNKLLFLALLQRRIIAMCRLHPAISVVHFNDGLLASICSFHTGYKHLRHTVTLHGLDVVFPSRLFQKYVLPRFNKFHKIFAVSQATSDACQRLGLNARLITVVPNGVDTSICSPLQNNNETQLVGQQFFTPTTKVFVCMGRPVKRKGFVWLIENVVPLLQGDYIILFIGPLNKRLTMQRLLLRLLPRKAQHKIALLLGAPTDERRLTELFSDVALAKNIQHVGKLPFTEIVRLLSRADFFLMPNISVDGDMEGFGLVCLEAALCGATVIAANVDGIPDAVHHQKNGLLLPSGNAQAWATALNDKLASPPMQNLNRGDVRTYTLNNFGWDKMVRSYWQHFSQINNISLTEPCKKLQSEGMD